MKKILIISHGEHQGNMMYSPNNTTYEEEIMFTDAESLEEFCEILVNAFENFDDALNYQTEIKKIAPQFENNNFAQIRFRYPSSIYNITIIAPKF